MDQKKDSILISQIRAEKSTNLIINLLEDNGASLEEYNSHILGILKEFKFGRNPRKSSHSIPKQKISKFINVNFIKYAHEQSRLLKSSPPIRTHGKWTDFVYSIKNLPSFSKKQKMLSKQEILTITRVFCEFYGLSLKIDESIILFLYEEIIKKFNK